MADDSRETPAQAARTEAARQVVILTASVVGALIIVGIQKQMLPGLLGLEDKTSRMASARRRERWYGRAAVAFATVGLWHTAIWCERRSALAAADYERECA